MKGFGGIPNVVIATPEIFSFKIMDNMDFILIGCDGIYDNLSNKEIFESIMATFDPETPVTVYNQNSKPIFKSKYKSDDINGQMGLIVDSIFKSCFKSYSSDNLSLILICFNGFENLFNSVCLKRNAQHLKEIRADLITLFPYMEKYQKSTVGARIKSRKISSNSSSRSG